MKTWRTTTLTPALAAVTSAAMAQSNAEVLRELQALKDRIAELEAKLKAGATPPAAPAPTAAAPGMTQGMTQEQASEFNRVAVKAEAPEDAREASGLNGLAISGYANPTYIYNKHQNRSGFQFLNRVDDDGYHYDNSYFGAASIDFLKETDNGTRWRLTLTPNRGVGSVFDGSSIVQEASVSVPLSDLQTRLIAGQVPDWSGYEYQQPTLNKLITQNLLYDFTLPTAFTGAGVEITRGKWIVKAMLAQVNASKNPQGESGSALTYRVDYSRGEFQGFGFAGVHGKLANFSEALTTPTSIDVFDPTGTTVIGTIPGFEVVGQRNSRVDLFEFDGYFNRGDWTLQGQLSFGQQKRAAITPDPVSGALLDARWVGLSGLAAYKFMPRLEGIVRADYIKNDKNGGGLLGYTASDDRNGIGPGWTFDDASGTWVQADTEKGSNRTAVSFGLSYLFNLNTTVKTEYRLDRANQAVFVDVKDGNYKKTNHLFGAAVVVSF